VAQGGWPRPGAPGPTGVVRSDSLRGSDRGRGFRTGRRPGDRDGGSTQISAHPLQEKNIYNGPNPTTKMGTSSHPSKPAATVTKPSIPQSVIAKPAPSKSVSTTTAHSAPPPKYPAPPPPKSPSPVSAPHPAPPHPAHPPAPPPPPGRGMMADAGNALATGLAMGTGQALASRALDAALGPQKVAVAHVENVTEYRGNFPNPKFMISLFHFRMPACLIYCVLNLCRPVRCVQGQILLCSGSFCFGYSRNGISGGPHSEAKAGSDGVGWMGWRLCSECYGRCLGCIPYIRAPNSRSQHPEWQMGTDGGSRFWLDLLLQSGYATDIVDSALN
jgi:hypothetical protein